MVQLSQYTLQICDALSFQIIFLQGQTNKGVFEWCLICSTFSGMWNGVGGVFRVEDCGTGLHIYVTAGCTLGLVWPHSPTFWALGRWFSHVQMIKVIRVVPFIAIVCPSIYISSATTCQIFQKCRNSPWNPLYGMLKPQGRGCCTHCFQNPGITIAPNTVYEPHPLKELQQLSSGGQNVEAASQSISGSENRCLAPAALPQHLTLLNNIQHYCPTLNSTTQHLTLLPNTFQHRSTLVNSTDHPSDISAALPTLYLLPDQPTNQPTCYWTNRGKLTKPKIHFPFVVFRKGSTKISEYCQNMLYIWCLLNNVKETMLKGKLGYWVINSLN